MLLLAPFCFLEINFNQGLIVQGMDRGMQLSIG